MRDIKLEFAMIIGQNRKTSAIIYEVANIEERLKVIEYM